MKRDLGSEGEKTINGGIIPPLSCIVGNDVPISRLVKTLIKYYFSKARVIYDPTCGDENYMFRDWIFDSKYDYISSDVKRTKYTMFQADVFFMPLRDCSCDVIVYDPPYVPYSRIDGRGSTYGISQAKSPMKVLSFYSRRVIESLWSCVRMGAIIKCADFYYPILSNNFYPILPLIYNTINEYFKIVAIHCYRYFYSHLPLIQYRLRVITKKHRRALISHTYFLICYKKSRS